jgi:hypothetical protein
MSMLFGLENAALTWMWSMDMDMQHGHDMQYGFWICCMAMYVHGVCPYLCSMDMDMHHGHGDAARMGMDT